jgi:two-component system, cell cycle sensor histidine kinase and response regulator CckA
MSANSSGTRFHPDAHNQYAQLVASIDGIVWEVDARTFEFLFVSAQAERLLGYPLAEWFRPGFWVDHIHPDDRAWALEFCQCAVQEKRNHDFEYRMIAADGRTVWLRDIVTVVVEGGEPVKLRGVMVDLTDKKRTEEALRESEVLYRLLTENSNDLVYLVDLDGTIVYASPSVGRLLGRVPRSKFEVVHPDDVAPGQAYWNRILAGEPGLLNVRVADAAGAWHWLEAWSSLIDYRGRPHVLSVCRDVTGRKRAEDERRASEARFRIFVDHASDAFFLHAADGTVLDANRQACASLGYTRDELIGMSPYAFDADIRRGDLDQFGARLAGNEVLTFDTHHRRKDGTVFPVEVRIRPFWEDGQRFAVSLVQDITDRKRAERALVESHNLLNAVVEGTADAVFVKDLDGRYRMINSAGARFLGRTAAEVTGKTDRELFTPETVENVLASDRQVLTTGQSQRFEETATAAGVTRTYLATKGVQRDARGQAVGLIGIAHDVTELKRLEEQFRQAQKMEAVGRLAGGVAHDFNNLLTVINGCSELVFDSLPPDDPNRELLAEVRRSGERAAGLTRQLLAFSRKQVLQPQAVNLNVLLDDLLKLLGRLIGADVELALVPDPALGLAKADPGQFEQAVINLAVNARDAMPNGGRLTIETRNVELDDGFAERTPEVKSGRYVLVTVTDTGHGMDGVTRAQIFEPFFTTKGLGEGTGLGLAMVYGFVKQSGGHVEVDSEPGRGTTFRVYLPRAAEAAPAARSSPNLLKMPRGTETVLLVEDEDAVRALARMILQSSGYTVLEAEDGQEAVSVAEQYPARIHLLLTDLVMPRMSGRQLADVLAKARPGLRILFMSGYTAEAVVGPGEPEAGVAFLHKPFSPIGLARKVREVLDATGW